VVDAEGKPAVAYHGTGKDFEAFDLDKSGSMSGSEGQRALFFATGPEAANHYALIAGTTGEGGRAEGAGMKVMPVYLRVENPRVSKLKYYNSADFEREIAKAKKNGNDGIVFPNIKADMMGVHEAGQIAVFDPAQVKSIFNRGSFDPSDPNILHQERLDANGARGWFRVFPDGTYEIGKTSFTVCQLQAVYSARRAAAAPGVPR
jgi:hypothetical protein